MARDDIKVRQARFLDRGSCLEERGQSGRPPVPGPFGAPAQTKGPALAFRPADRASVIRAMESLGRVRLLDPESASQPLRKAAEHGRTEDTGKNERRLVKRAGEGQDPPAPAFG
jgi:hypothetical protein